MWDRSTNWKTLGNVDQDDWFISPHYDLRDLREYKGFSIIHYDCLILLKFRIRSNSRMSFMNSDDSRRKSPFVWLMAWSESFEE